MSAYFDAARSAIERHGGPLEKFIVDAVTARGGRDRPLARIREHPTEIRLRNGEILLAWNGEARSALDRAREVAEGKGSTVLVARAGELLARLDARS